MPFDERYVEHTGPHCAGSCEGAAYQIEIQKLRHDIERLEAERDDHEQARTALEEMVGQLQAENEALREALGVLLKLHDESVYVKEPWDRAMEYARAALAAHDQGGDQ